MSKDDGWKVCGRDWPEENGKKYWVWPYITLSGKKVVEQSYFVLDASGPHFEGTYPPQEYTHWKAIEKPDPPYTN